MVTPLHRLTSPVFGRAADSLVANGAALTLVEPFHETLTALVGRSADAATVEEIVGRLQAQPRTKALAGELDDAHVGVVGEYAEAAYLLGVAVGARLSAADSGAFDRLTFKLRELARVNPASIRALEKTTDTLLQTLS